MENNKKEYLNPKISMIFQLEDILCLSKDDGTADVYTTTWKDANIYDGNKLQ